MNENNYYERVYEVTRKVPFGRVTTYGAIADYLTLGAARMVGWALNKCASSNHSVPAHRVVNRKGELSGRNHFSSPTIMEELLRNEGINVENNQVQDFKNIFWNPSVEIE
ncbi:MAG: MGMT family protein [Bacteroidetes bacterium]|nr:MGMT family protein [Bacteroidota bacterium]